MPRNQQKAVFANLGKGNSTVSNMSARRESLMHNSLVAENQQDKIDRIMRDSRLTHRQKMDRIARVKSGKHSSGSSDTGVPVAGSKTSHVDTPAVKLIYQKVLLKAEERRLQRKAYREKHPGAVFEPTKKPGVYLLKEHGETFTWKDGKKVPPTMKQNIADAKKMGKEAHERRKKSKGSSLKGRSNFYKDAYATKGEAEGIKDYLEHEGHTDVFIFTDKSGDWNIAYNKKSDPQGTPRKSSNKTLYLVKFVNKDTKQRDFREISAKNRKDARKILLRQQNNVGIISIHEKTAKATLLEKKLLARKQFRVGVILPGVGGPKGTVVKSDLMTKKKAEALALKKRKLGWDTARAYEVKKKKRSKL